MLSTIEPDQNDGAILGVNRIDANHRSIWRVTINDID
jgi:hypothetical protein